MSIRRFYTELLFVSVACAIALQWMHLRPQWVDHAPLSWISLAFFILLCVGVFHAGRAAVHSANKKAFTQLVLVATVGKMMVAALIVLIYMRLANPGSKWFVAPFLGLYLVYTAYETYMLMALGKMET